MTMQKAKDTVFRLVVEHFANPKLIGELCTPGFTVHWAWGMQTEGAAEVESLLAGMQTCRVEVDDIFAEGDRVAVRFRVLFLHELSGKEISRNEIAIFVFDGERIAEAWIYFDRQFENEQREQLNFVAPPKTSSDAEISKQG